MTHMAAISSQLKAARTSASARRKNHTYTLAISFLSCSFLLQLVILTANFRAISSKTSTDFSPLYGEEANGPRYDHENVVHLPPSSPGRASEHDFPDLRVKKEMLDAEEDVAAVISQKEGSRLHETALTAFDSRGSEFDFSGRQRRLQEKSLPEGVQALLVVSTERRGRNYRTVQEAVDAIPMWTYANWVVYIKPGIYYGTVVVPRGKNYITFIGEGPEVTTLSCERNAGETPMGIQGCPCVIVEASYFTASNIAFENTSPRPDVNDHDAQSPAIRISGDNASFFGCFFLAWQDTLYADQGRHYYENCRVEGSVDFILGYARALFKNCTIYSRGPGFITAQSRWCDSDCPAASSAFVFLNCSLAGFGPTYLGRPWREYAKVVYVDSRMGSHIAPEGWDDWLEGTWPEERPLFSHNQVYFAERNSRGPGASPRARVSWSHPIQEAEVEAHSYRNVKAFLDGDSWLQKQPSLHDLLNSVLTRSFSPYTSLNGREGRYRRRRKADLEYKPLL